MSEEEEENAKKKPQTFTKFYNMCQRSKKINRRKEIRSGLNSPKKRITIYKRKTNRTKGIAERTDFITSKRVKKHFFCVQSIPMFLYWVVKVSHQNMLSMVDLDFLDLPLPWNILLKSWFLIGNRRKIHSQNPFPVTFSFTLLLILIFFLLLSFQYIFSSSLSLFSIYRKQHTLYLIVIAYYIVAHPSTHIIYRRTKTNYFFSSVLIFTIGNEKLRNFDNFWSPNASSGGFETTFFGLSIPFLV